MSASDIRTRPIASPPCSRSPTGLSRRRATTSAAGTSRTREPVAPPSGLRSVTVVGPRLAFTDAYATAVYVMGLDGLTWLASDGRGDDYAAYAITDDDRAVWTEGMDRYLVRED